MERRRPGKKVEGLENEADLFVPDAGEIVWTWVPYTENDGRFSASEVEISVRLHGQAYEIANAVAKDDPRAPPLYPRVSAMSVKATCGAVFHDAVH